MGLSTVLHRNLSLLLVPPLRRLFIRFHSFQSRFKGAAIAGANDPHLRRSRRPNLRPFLGPVHLRNLPIARDGHFRIFNFNVATYLYDAVYGIDDYQLGLYEARR